jgi:hypothetical protein
VVIKSDFEAVFFDLDDTLLNFKEDKDFEFTYAEGQPLEFSENTHITNITSVLAFYAYIVIGLDYDSYGLLAGTEYLLKAKQILNNAQSDQDLSWQAFGTGNQRNRFYFIEHITNNANSPLRRFYYRYHRLGLDRMSEQVESGRTEIANSMQLLKKVYNSQNDSYFLDIVMSTKLREIINIFSESTMQQKRIVHQILKDIDPTNSNIDKIIQTGDR